MPRRGLRGAGLTNHAPRQPRRHPHVLYNINGAKVPGQLCSRNAACKCDVNGFGQTGYGWFM